MMFKLKLLLTLFCFGVLGKVNGQDTAASILNSAEVMPEFPGGEEALMQYLSEHIEYPKQAMENGITGTVYISFEVCEDGKLCKVKTLRDIGGGCAEAAAEVVKTMPDWTPGYKDGKPVKVIYTLPVRFETEDRLSRKERKAERKRIRNLVKEQ